jgi:hypothetical protein
MEPNKVIKDKITEDNYKVFALLSNYLNHEPDFVKEEEITEIVQCGVSAEYAFAAILAAVFGLDVVDNVDDQDLFNNYFNHMLHKLDANKYYGDPYYKNIKIPTINIGHSKLIYQKYKPFEGFVCNDIIQTEEGRQIPQIGFFETEFLFPAMMENDRLWMSITPNEIETMKEPIYKAFGNVLTFGLGMGYYAYRASQKDNVESVTVVESNENVIDLFNKFVLPQFGKAQKKIKLIRADAFEYAQRHMANRKYDCVFTDLWHDVSDGINSYLKMKKYEKQSPDTVFTYWIEKSILCYL